MGIYGTRDGKFIAKKVVVEDKIPMKYAIASATAVSSVNILAAWDVSAGTASKTNDDFLIQPPYPVNLSVNAAVVGTADESDLLEFVGINAKGETVSETVIVGSTAQNTNYTVNAYAKITSITPDDALHKSTDVNIGISSALGLPYPIATSTDVLSYSVNGVVGTAIVGAPLSVDTTYDLIRPTSVTGGDIIEITYRSKLQ